MRPFSRRRYPVGPFRHKPLLLGAADVERKFMRAGSERNRFAPDPVVIGAIHFVLRVTDDAIRIAGLERLPKKASG